MSRPWRVSLTASVVDRLPVTWTGATMFARILTRVALGEVGRFVGPSVEHVHRVPHERPRSGAEGDPPTGVG